MVAGEAVLFRAEDEGDAAVVAGQLSFQERGEGGEGDDGLLWFAMGEGAGAGDEGAIGEGFGQGGEFAGGGEEVGRADGGFGFTPVGRVGRCDGEMGEAEVGHGAGDGADVERVARGDEDDFEAVALGGGEQGSIVDARRFEPSKTPRAKSPTSRDQIRRRSRGRRPFPFLGTNR